MENIHSIVKTKNISVNKESSIFEAIKVMYKNDQGTVIILDQDKTVGILTERDVVELLALKTDFNQPVIAVAERKVIGININRSVEYALHVLIDNNIRRLTIISDEGKFIGILTQQMLMNKLEDDHYRINLTVSQILSCDTVNIVTLPLHGTLEDAISRMRSREIGSVLVIDDDAMFIGIVTERDLVRFVSQSIPMDTPIHTVMSSPVVSVSVNDNIQDIVTMMHHKHIQRVLVTDKEGNACGIVSTRDIVKNIKGNYSLFVENKLKYTKQTLNAIEEVIFELHISKGETLIQWANYSAIEMYDEGILDKPLNTLVDAEVWKDVVKTLLQENNISNYKIKIGDYWHMISCNHYDNGLTGQSFLLVCKDVTAYEEHITQAQEAWVKRERMELALLGSNDGIGDWNLLDNSIYFSPRWKEMLGYKESEIPNLFLTWEERVHPDELEGTMLAIQNNLEGKTEYFENTHRLKHKNGSWVWILVRGKTLFDKQGKAIRMIGTHTDITEEKELQLKYEKQVKILEEIHDCIVSTDLEGVITSWNCGAERLMGYTSNEIVGKPITVLYKEEDIPTMHENIGKLMQTGKIQIEACLLKKTKEHTDVSLSLSLLRGENGEPVGTIGYAQDITKQKQAQNEIKRLNTNLQQEVNQQLKQIREKDIQLLQQSRMAQMGEMLSMIAHQWRQPLAAISSTSASLELKASLNKLDNDTVLEKVQDISSFAQYLSKTIDDFRDFFKPNKKKIKTSYCKLLRSALEIIGVSIKNNNIELIQELNCNDMFITYPNELQQVILNLIKNAEDALIEKEIENPYIKISTYKENNQYVLEVSDNGGGISKNIMDNIFDPYFSTKTKKDGTGLGLYMSKTIIEEHCNGELNVINTKDGALFKIILN